MRTSYALIAVALSAVGAVATSNHAGQAPRHLRQKRAWCVGPQVSSTPALYSALTLEWRHRGHRRAESVASPTVSAESPSETFLSAVPEVVPASVTVTISNTEAQSPQTTAQAVGATQAAVAPLTCAPSVGLHGSCDPNAGACWCVETEPPFGLRADDSVLAAQPIWPHLLRPSLRGAVHDRHPRALLRCRLALQRGTRLHLLQEPMPPSVGRNPRSARGAVRPGFWQHSLLVRCFSRTTLLRPRPDLDTTPSAFPAKASASVAPASRARSTPDAALDRLWRCLPSPYSALPPIPKVPPSCSPPSAFAYCHD